MAKFGMDFRAETTSDPFSSLKEALEALKVDTNVRKDSVAQKTTSDNEKSFFHPFHRVEIN